MIVLAKKRRNPSKQDKNDNESSSSHDEQLYSHLPPHIQRQLRKEQKRLEKLSYLSMKSPMYDNVRMVDPQGELLCTISKKKANWYIEKKLASWTDEQNKNTIKLFFEPKNRSNRGESGIYVRSDKINQCVVCGNTEYHMRHYVVPFAYRTLFPKKFKSHLSHDIVILCPQCHVYCDQQRQARMKDIENQYRIPGEERTAQQFITDSRLYHLRSCALALLRSRNKLPDTKITNYETLVREHLGVSSELELTKEQLQKVVNVEYKVENENYISGPELIMRALGDDDEKIADFVKGWRIHFLETMRPKFLPQGWGVDSSVVCGED